MSNFTTIPSTTTNNVDDQVLVRQDGNDWKQSKESLAVGIANARWTDTGTYLKGSVCVGSDSTLYQAKANNGVSTSLGVTDPTTDTSNVAWDKLDVRYLNGKEESFYTNASNLSSGTISDERLPNNITSDITGNASTASKLETPITLYAIGDATGNVELDGSEDVSLTLDVKNDSHSHTGSTLSAINASTITTGTLNDARLPSVITSDITGNASTADNADHADNASLLEGKDKAFYTNAFNLNSGVVGNDRLPDTITSDITGNAGTASKLATPRSITLTGDLTGTAPFDGSGNVDINVSVDGFDGLLQENGYQKFPNGLIMQWGTYSGAHGDGTHTVTLPIPFSHKVLQVSGTVGKAINYGTDDVSNSAGKNRGSLSTILVTIDHRQATAWKAIGY